MATSLPIIFHQAARRDVPQLVEMYLECFRQWIDDKAAGAYFARVVDDPDFNVIVAEDKPGHIAGFIVTNCAQAGSHKAANIDVMAVGRGLRRNGLGRTLLRLAEAAAHGRGARKLTLQVVENNEPAKQLYLALEFNPAGRHPSYYRDGSAALEMSKPLPERLAANDPPLPATLASPRRKSFWRFGF